MRRWLLLILLCRIPLSLAWAEPFLSTQGPIMETVEAAGIIVVNEMSISVDSSTPITDEKGRSLSFRHLKPGRWVSVEAEPDEDSGIVAKRIVLIHKPRRKVWKGP